MIRPSTFQYAHDADTSVATITLNRPDRLNALTFETYEELRRAFRAINDQEHTWTSPPRCNPRRRFRRR